MRGFRCFHFCPAALTISLIACWFVAGLTRADEAQRESKDEVVKAADHDAAKPSLHSASATAAETLPPTAHKLRFQFRFQPWKDVLDWFAQQADLSLVMDAAPPGTFNYSDSREYTPAEAIDLLNSVLLTKGYTLIRRQRMLMLVNLADGIPPNLVSTVPVASLDSKGEFEVVSVLFNVEKLKPEEAEAEIKKLLGPQGSVVALSKSRQVLVTETAGRLRTIRDMLAKIETPEDTTSQIEVYPITAADPQSVLGVLQTLLAGQPEVRLVIDPKTNNLIALARLSQHATIRATLAQLQREGQRVEVLHLFRVDPQTAAASIAKLFGSGDANKGTAPQVDADPATRQLMIRGTEAQILQIRGLLEKMGEVLTVAGGSTQGGRVRTVPLSGSAARSALERIQEIWPTLHPNKIRVITPSSALLGAPANSKESGGIPPELLKRLHELQPSDALPEEQPTPDEKPVEPEPESMKPSKPSSAVEPTAELPRGARLVYVAEHRAAAKPAESKTPAPIIVVPGPNGLIIASEDSEALDQFERLLDMLSGGPANARAVTVFYLKHAKAAAIAEALAQILGGGTASSAAAARTSAAAASSSGGPFGGGSPFDFGGGFGGGGRFGGGRRGQSSDNTAPSNASSTVTSVAGASASREGLATGAVRITSDQRLNALLVQANRTDLDTIEGLLKILDQKESPEDIALAPKPRMIAVQNTQAQEIAEIVKQVYSDRLVQSAGSGGSPREMMAQMFVARAMGGGGGQRGAQARPGDDVARMSIGVDTRTNSLIVAAPDPLFEEVKQLVSQLDVAAGDQNEAVRRDRSASHQPQRRGASLGGHYR